MVIHEREIVEVGARTGMFGRLILQIKRATAAYDFPGAPPKAGVSQWRDARLKELTLEDLGRIQEIIAARKKS